MKLADAIRSNPQQSDWITWLIEDNSKAALETIAFLSRCFASIPSSKKTKLLRRLRRGDSEEIEATLFELVVHELLRRLHWHPEWSPSIARLNPDLEFDVDGTAFIADVLLVQSPSKTIRKYSENTIESWDHPLNPAESRAKKISDRISDKATKYSGLDAPLVLFVFLGDRHLLDTAKVEKALYGMTVGEILQEKHYPYKLEHGYPYPGILLPQEELDLPHRNLSAVLACRWFDTLNRGDEGKRLSCIVLHNWSPTCALPLKVFSAFGQLAWRNLDNGGVEPYYYGDPNTVAKFLEGDDVVFKPYSSTAPW